MHTQNSKSMGIKLIQAELKKVLSSYKVPKKIIEISEIPRNELGKIIYSKL